MHIYTCATFPLFYSSGSVRCAGRAHTVLETSHVDLLKLPGTPQAALFVNKSGDKPFCDVLAKNGSVLQSYVHSQCGQWY